MYGYGRLTAWKNIVITNVWIGLMFGNTAKTVSPTNPLEVEITPETFIAVSKPAYLTSIKEHSQANNTQY